jgi:hypothetical protein
MRENHEWTQMNTKWDPTPSELDDQRVFIWFLKHSVSKPIDHLQCTSNDSVCLSSQNKFVGIRVHSWFIQNVPYAVK